jgi:hypothetical protein
VSLPCEEMIASHKAPICVGTQIFDIFMNLVGGGSVGVIGD